MDAIIHVPSDPKGARCMNMGQQWIDSFYARIHPLHIGGGEEKVVGTWAPLMGRHCILESSVLLVNVTVTHQTVFGLWALRARTDMQRFAILHRTASLLSHKNALAGETLSSQFCIEGCETDPGPGTRGPS